MWRRGKWIVFLGAGSLAASAAALTHLVRKDETLSQIAKRHLPGRVYGERGSLKQLLQANPSVRNPNLIFVGQSIQVPGDHETTLVERVPSQESSIDRRPAEDVSNSEQTWNNQTNFAFTVRFLQSRLDAKDLSTGDKAIMASDFTPELGVVWSQNWNSGAKSFLQTRARREHYQTTSSTQSLTQNKPLLWGFGVGASLFSFSTTGSFWAKVNLDQESFVRAENSTTITFDSVMVPKLGLILRADLARAKGLRLVSEFSADYLVPVKTDSFSTKSAYALASSLIFHYEQKSYPIFGGLTMDYQDQDTSLVSQQHLSLGLKFGFHWDGSHQEDASP